MRQHPLTLTVYKELSAMAIYSVYWLHLPNQLDVKTQGYVGVSNNPKRRLSEHKLASKNGNNQNPYLGRILNKYEVLQTVIFQGTEAECYSQEELLRPKKNIGWNANRGGITPPSKKGWTPSKETLEKRSKSLKGMPRTDEWCKNLSESKKEKKNGMYGRNHSQETLDKKRQAMLEFWAKKKAQVL